MSNVTPPIDPSTPMATVVGNIRPPPQEQGTETGSTMTTSTSDSPKKEEASEPQEEDSTSTYVPPPRPAFRTSSNDDILQQTLGMTDLIFAIYAVEVWRYDEETGKIFNVNLSSDDEETGGGGGAGGSGGLLIKRNPQEIDIDNDYYTEEAEGAFYQLTDASRSDFLPAGSADPGVGLAGALWAESSGSAGGGVNFRALGENKLLHNAYDAFVSLTWRDVKELAEDPDQVCVFKCMLATLTILFFHIYISHHIMNTLPRSHLMRVCRHLQRQDSS